MLNAISESVRAVAMAVSDIIYLYFDYSHSAVVRKTGTKDILSGWRSWIWLNIRFQRALSYRVFFLFLFLVFLFLAVMKYNIYMRV